jgi:hypothetical protein
MRGAILPRHVPNPGRRRAAWVVLAILLVLLLAWYDGGERETQVIEVEIPVPEGVL